MRLKIQIILGLLFSTVLLTACGGWSYSPINTNVKVLENKEGHAVFDCNGKLIPYRSDGVKDFWQENNLPKGTTDFICKNGKAYLPNQVPNN